MDLITVCPKLIPVNCEGTFFRGFITAEVIYCCHSCIRCNITVLYLRFRWILTESGRGRSVFMQPMRLSSFIVVQVRARIFFRIAALLLILPLCN